MKNTYMKPELEVLELNTENQLLVTLSGATGTGSNMLDPDHQDPFSSITF